MNHQRLEIKHGDKVTVVWLNKLVPLDGAGGRLRQRFEVLDHHQQVIGQVTRYRSEFGTAIRWQSVTPGYIRTDHSTRGEAITHLLNNQRESTT